MRSGFSLVETTVVLALIAIVAAFVIPAATGQVDRVLVSNAAGSVVSFYGGARYGALLRGSQVRVEFAGDSLKAYYEDRVDSLFLGVAGPSRHGVNIRTSRAVIRLHPNGMGLGAANTRIVLWRGEAVESLTTSRLGRIKRWR